MKIIIIGAGPGGYETAVEAAKKGCEVVLVSGGPLGGTCLNEGCIPTKTFCHYASAAQSGTSLSAFQEKKAAVVAQLQSGITSLLKGVTVVQGQASFVDAKTVEVGGVRYSGDAVIIATGSVSAVLPVPGSEYCLNSTQILELQEVPSRLTVIGGGVIGLEFASIFQSLGSQVTVVEYCPQLLPRFDADLAKRLKASLAKKGITIELSALVTAVSADKTVTYLKGGEEKNVEGDAVLMAVGRKANFEGLNLEAAGVETEKRGVKVDSRFRTNVPGIYAIGDVTGGLMLAHVATAQGRAALADILGEECGIDFNVVPAAVFTVPEVATVGLTEEDCAARGLQYKAGKAFYRANGKAVSMEESDGYCKVLVSAEGKILGAHIMGVHASDLIHEFAILMNFDIDATRAVSVIHAHPTLSEVALAALVNATI